jgi:hypothetical protein
MMDNEDQEGDKRTATGPPRQGARDFDQSNAKVDTTGKKRDFSHIIGPPSDYPGGTSFSSETGELKTKRDVQNQDQKGEIHSSANKDFAEAAAKKPKGERV